MKVAITRTEQATAAFIAVDAGVRYWEDATVNGEQDDAGTIPGRSGDRWKVKIDLRTGKVVDWPEGTTASVHYKVCDDGVYDLLDENGTALLRRDGCVPDDFLCHGDDGYGDYIIFTVGGDGQIADFGLPEWFDEEGWEPA